MTLTLSTCGPIVLDAMFWVSLGFFAVTAGLIIFEKYF
jgi:hypothetical protein